VLAEEVFAVLDALEAAALQVWLDGGWGIDSLLGAQTREHEDVDIVVVLNRFEDLLHALEPLGFRLVEDYLPTRAVLRNSDLRQVDVHPVTFDENGIGWQRHAAPDGTDCPYLAEGFGHGRLVGRVVPCLTAELQVEHHRGYEPRQRDRLDMAALAAAFGLELPDPY